jgi:hypothetical protein
MTGDIESIAGGIADIGTAAAVAGAIERERDGGAGGHTHEGVCLNCGTVLRGPHCHACGQRAHLHRTIGAFFHDLIHGVLHFEGKTWRTLPLLAWQPGKLTREYIDGRRASYVSPIALFLFVVFLSFGLFNALGDVSDLESDIGIDPGRSMATVKADIDEQIKDLQVRRKDAIDANKSPTQIDRQIAELRTDRTELDEITTTRGSGKVTGKGPGGEAVAQGLNATWRKAKENPSLMIYKAQTSAYKYSWMLIPLSVPFVWLLFPFARRFKGYDHTVFVTYSITFMIALVAVSCLLIYAGVAVAGGLLLLYAPFHMYRQLRGTYGVGRFGALWRMLALSLFAWIAIGLFAGLIGWMAMGH